ncbi:glutathione binding-like protein [Pendulispora albinea]|uniref:Glutathione binding-like protein n=1 Tax=Pendulispora albinea TaxID=2741071 RepID=A0ABZ2M823_9BACT
MQLYFSPLACSLSSRIALYEAGADATYVEVDPKTKLIRDGNDFREDYRGVHPLGLVPLVRTDDGELLTENAAILQYIAACYPDAKLAPENGLGRARLHQWLCFIGTELHKALFVPTMDAKAPPEVKAYALQRETSRLTYVDAHLRDREFLLDHFSVADAYLFAILNWTAVAPIDLAKYPALGAFMARMRKRPMVAKAFTEERALYMEEVARHAAATKA